MNKRKREVHDLAIREDEAAVVCTMFHLAYRNGHMSFFPIRIEWGHVSYDLRERLNGIQEVSGSIPLISTKGYDERLVSNRNKPLPFIKLHIGMILALEKGVIDFTGKTDRNTANEIKRLCDIT